MRARHGVCIESGVTCGRRGPRGARVCAVNRRLWAGGGGWRAAARAGGGALSRGPHRQADAPAGTAGGRAVRKEKRKTIGTTQKASCNVGCVAGVNRATPSWRGAACCCWKQNAPPTTCAALFHSHWLVPWFLPRYHPLPPHNGRGQDPPVHRECWRRACHLGLPPPGRPPPAAPACAKTRVLNMALPPPRAQVICGVSGTPRRRRAARAAISPLHPPRRPPGARRPRPATPPHTPARCA